MVYFIYPVSELIEMNVFENLFSVSDMLDEDLINQVSKLIKREFKAIFFKRPIVKVHINRV